jgi:hypothetical protein
MPVEQQRFDDIKPATRKIIQTRSDATPWEDSVQWTKENEQHYINSGLQYRIIEETISRRIVK